MRSQLQIHGFQDDTFEQLLVGLRRGDQSKTESLFRLSLERLQRICQYRLNQFHSYGIIDGDDLAASIFAELLLRPTWLPEWVVNRESFDRYLSLVSKQRASREAHRSRKERCRCTRESDSAGSKLCSICDTNSRSETDTIDASDLLARSLDVLPTNLIPIARMYLKHCTIATIAMTLDSCESTVKRKVKRIQKIWKKWIKSQGLSVLPQ
jgi:DNA-directed RNA polymerase specialized sigma24 family protein